MGIASQKVKNDLRAAYNDIAREFSASRKYPWPEIELFIPHLGPHFNILDLGCGNGRLLESLTTLEQRFSYLGVDFSSELIKEAKEKYPNQRFVTADMMEVDFDRDSFDAVAMIASFHHIPTQGERLELLQKIHKWLKPGGVLFMTNWNLWQKKYLRFALERFWAKNAWNDFFIPWKDYQGQTYWRYYHSFAMGELIWLLKKSGFSLDPEGVYKSQFNINALVKKPNPALREGLGKVR